MLSIIKKRKIWYIASSVMIVIGFIVVGVKGIRYGIDFTGGSLLEIQYTNQVATPEQINEIVSTFGIQSLQVQKVNDNGYLLRMPEISDETRREIVSGLNEQISNLSILEDSIDYTEEGDGSTVVKEGLNNEMSGNSVEELQFESIGPVIGQELKTKSIWAIVVVLLAILVYVAWAFRKVSWPVQSWKYGTVALITLFHDVLITFCAFVLLSHIFGWEINTAFVAAILTILGYSVNDTIVVFDRIRENVPRLSGTFADIVNVSINQTISRSINTSFTTLLVLLAIFFLGGTTLKGFVATLIIGIIIGTYSSIFIASPILVTWKNYNKKD